MFYRYIIEIKMITSEAQRRAAKKWRGKNREHLREYERQRYQERKKYMKKYSKKSTEKARKRVNDILGRKCYLCNRSPNRIYSHEIHGKKHPSGPFYILNHIKDFVRLCGFCHQKIHWCMKHLNMTWEEICQKYS